MTSKPSYGYYFFLGVGDFTRGDMYTPKVPGPEFTVSWTADDWRKRIDVLADYGVNILFIYLMGYLLPFKTEEYPECVDEDHPNVKDDFFQEVVDHCHQRQISVVAVFTTTGHACSFISKHPELSIQDKDRQPATLRRGILCHHSEEARQYPIRLIRECLTRYHGFDGVSLHPPEFVSSPCYCEKCCAQYRKEKGGDLLRVAESEAKSFFMETNLRFQKAELESMIHELLPDAQSYVFTIPPIFGEAFESFGKEIDPETIIVEWDYRLSEANFATLMERLNRFRQFGHHVWFMPTCGYSFPEPPNRDRTDAENLDMVREQIRRVKANGIHDIVSFSGPRWWPGIDALNNHSRSLL